MPKRKLPKDDKVISLYKQGYSSNEIAKMYNLANGSTVVKMLKKHGVTRTYSEAQKQSFSKGRKPTKFWEGKKQPPEMVEKRISKIRGKNHYLYKDGLSTRKYRDTVKKEKCSLCNSKKNLCIHHSDFDHYNDDPDNLVVLCVSCHISLHKTEYWRCKKLGLEYKNNAPIGWRK